MYRGFHITKETILEIYHYLKADDVCEVYQKELAKLDKKSGSITAQIAAIIKGDANGIIDGESLLQACMPTNTGQYDIFISHSHLDEDLAKDLAVYLWMKYGVKCFVDGFVWGSCDKDILRPIDRKYSRHDTEPHSFSYEKRNYSTSHVHAMLSMALLEMMDQCECCLFIKPNKDYDIADIENFTLSPWIYEEITMFNKILKRKPSRMIRCTESFSVTRPRLSIRYKLDLSNMPELKAFHLSKCITLGSQVREYTQAYGWLDYLYDNLK